MWGRGDVGDDRKPKRANKERILTEFRMEWMDGAVWGHSSHWARGDAVFGNGPSNVTSAWITGLRDYGIAGILEYWNVGMLDFSVSAGITPRQSSQEKNRFSGGRVMQMHTMDRVISDQSTK